MKKIQNKIYPRKEMKLWGSACDMCCMECPEIDICDEACIKEDITCNQCTYGGELLDS